MRISDWSSDVCSSDLRESGWSEVRNRLIVGNQTNLCARQTKDRDELFDGSLSPWMAELWLSLRQRGVDDREGLEAASVPEGGRSEEHTSELQSLMRISYAVFYLKTKKIKPNKL